MNQKQTFAADLNHDLTLDEWLASTQKRREDLEAYAISPLPVDASERHADMDLAIQNCDDAARLLADAESFLAHACGQAVMEVRRLHPDLNAEERKVMARNEVRGLKRLVDGLSVTHATIKSRIYSILNANRSR